jgi:alanine dehydrogenase
MLIRILSAEDVHKALPMRLAVEAVQKAFAQLSTGMAEVPLRVGLQVPSRHGVVLFMPGLLKGDDQLALKVVSVFNDNPAKGLPLIHALVVVVDAETGAPTAVMDGAYLTALRTGAASGAATDLLARQDSRTAAIFGAGVQARTQLEAVQAVRPIQEAWVYDLHPQRASNYALEMSNMLSLRIHVAGSPSEAVNHADVICTATTSTSPVFNDADLKPGAHINAVGAYTPEMQEIPAETVRRSKIVIDHHLASMAEAGDLLIPLNQGLISKDDIYAELGEIAAGLKAGRESPEEITFFKSVGVAVQDVAAANAVLQAARKLNLGTEINL